MEGQELQEVCEVQGEPDDAQASVGLHQRHLPSRYHRTVTFIDEHSAGVIRVSSVTDPTKLAASITLALLDKRNNGRIVVRASGLQPVNIAAKAIIIASGNLFQRGKAFLRMDSFDTIRTQDGVDLTVICANLKLVDRAELDRLNSM